MAYNEFDDIESMESNRISFDFKGFLFKVINLWKFVLLCIGAALIIAYLINVRKENVYKLDSLISVENDQNPFFTANTSISFNWGGVSGKMGKTITTLKTRTHNEKVVDSLQFYMNYFVDGKYKKVDIYKQAPFKAVLDLTKPQVLNKYIGVRFISSVQFEIFTEFEGTKGRGQRYDTKEVASVEVPLGAFSKVYAVGEKVALPFFSGTLEFRTEKQIKPGTEFYLRFNSFDAVVNSYKNSINVGSFNATNSPVLELSLAGTNKGKIVDFLNATAAILSKTELEHKNLYATNTIKFIDSSLAAVDTSLKDVTKEMNSFRKKNKVFDVDVEMMDVSSRLKVFEAEKEGQQTKLDYLNRLENYLQTKTDYTNIAAPTSVGISEGNILNSVRKITGLAIERKNLEYTTREESEIFKNIDRQIDAEKNVLLETIKSTISTINIQLGTLNRNIANLDVKLRDLPEDQQEYLKIQRKLDISQETYDV
ncbi:MAG: sugar transporter, partial [Oceanihabitans sp.]|nr:sugar transporter [Oceanihabitans sp.]